LKDALFHEYNDFPNFLTEDSDENARSLSARSLQAPSNNAYVNAYQRQLDNYQEDINRDVHGDFGEKNVQERDNHQPDQTAPRNNANTYQTRQPSYQDPQDYYNVYEEPEPEYNLRKQDPTYGPPDPTYGPPEPVYRAPEPTYGPPKSSYYQTPAFQQPEQSYQEPELEYQAQPTAFPNLQPFQETDINSYKPQPEPNYQPDPVYRQPEPAYTPPSYYHPESDYQPEVTYHQPEVHYHQPEVTYHQPEPTYHQPATAYKPPPVLNNPTYHDGHDEHDEYGHHGVRGVPGKDYPIYSELPPTKFTCDSVPIRPGMYADVDSQCQVSFNFYFKNTSDAQFNSGNKFIELKFHSVKLPFNCRRLLNPQNISRKFQFI
jgi:hypothetical protein